MEKHYEEKDQFPELIDGGQVDEAIVNTPPTEKGVFNTGITSTQIEQVVDLPIPTTDDSGKVLKVDAEGKWELATDSEGIVVVANPTLAGTEANLTGLQVGAVKYKVPEGMQVLELTNSSGTLNDAQYELVSGDNCVIKYNNVYYRKLVDGENESLIIYFDPRCYNTETNLYQYSIRITKSTKEFVTGNITTSLNINYVEANPTLAGTESSLAGLQVGSIKYKVGSEVIAYEGTSLLPSGVTASGWSIHRALKDGNVLWIFVSAQLTNTNAESVNVQSLYSFALPTDIQSKIYRRDGTTINNNYTSKISVLTAVGTKDDSEYRFRLKSDSAGSFYIDLNSLTSLSATQMLDVEVRIPIFLDIGTVQQ